MSNRTFLSLLPLTALTAILASTPVATAAQEVDDRWLPWTGCWQAESDGLLCIEMADGGVEFLSVGDEGVVSEQSIVADGVARPIEDETCSGTEAAEFSLDGERVYLREDVTCGAQSQIVHGVIAMLSPSEWVDIRGADNGRGVYSRTFRRVSDAFATSRGFPDANNDDDLTARMRRWAVSEPSDIDDLLEVLDRTGEGVTSAWVLEQIDPFPVNAEFLVALDEAGIPDDVIDVMVAQAFPNEFYVADNGAGRRSSAGLAGGSGAFVGGSPFLVGDPFFNPWSWRYRGFGNAFGWGPGFGVGGFGFGWPFNERVIVVRRSGDFPTTTRNGVRPVPGGGYVGTNRGSSGGSVSRAAPPRTSVSSGSAGRSTGRKAKPRTGGGGGPF